MSDEPLRYVVSCRRCGTAYGSDVSRGPRKRPCPACAQRREERLKRRLFVTTGPRVPIVDVSDGEGLMILKRAHATLPWAVYTIDVWGDPRPVAAFTSAAGARAHIRRLKGGAT